MSVLENFPSLDNFKCKIVELKAINNDLSKKLMYYLTLSVRTFKKCKESDEEGMLALLGKEDFNLISSFIDIYEQENAKKFMVLCLTYGNNTSIIKYIENNKDDAATLFIAENLKNEMINIIGKKDFHTNNVMKDKLWAEEEKESMIYTINIQTEMYKNQVKKLRNLLKKQS